MLSRPGSLRGRLALAMLAVSALAIAASVLLNDHGEGAPAHGWRAALSREPYQDGLVLAALTALLLALIWLVSIWSLRPLERAAREARGVGPANPGARISVSGLPAEIRPLVEACNGALDRLADAYEAERRLAANAAHGLRTPLSVLRLRLQQAQLAGAPDWTGVERDMAQLQRLVSQLLDLTRAAQSARSGREPEQVNLARIAREAAAIILPRAEAVGRRLELDVPDALPMAGRAGDLRDMILNLLDNAMTHGSGTVTLRAVAEGRLRIIEVADEGPGLPEAQRAALFEPFRTGSGTGTGLGLAIVQEVARAHGGTAGFLPAPTCRVRVTLAA